MLGKQLARLESEIQDSEARLRLDDARLRHSVHALRNGARKVAGSKAVMVGGALLGALTTFWFSRSRRRHPPPHPADYAYAYAAPRGYRRRRSWFSAFQRWSPILMPVVSPLLDRKVAMLLASLGVPVVIKPFAPLPTMTQVDLARYAGRWYEIARLPTRNEKSCASDVSADYVPDEKGGFTVTNRCVRADGGVDEVEGRLRVPDVRAPGELEVTFAPSTLRLWPGVWTDYWLLFVDDSYSVALVGEPDRDRLWVMARDTSVAPADFDALKSLAARHGFDTTRLVMTSHTVARAV